VEWNVKYRVEVTLAKILKVSLVEFRGEWIFYQDLLAYLLGMLK